MPERLIHVHRSCSICKRMRRSDGDNRRGALIPAVGSPDGCPALGLTDGTGPSRVIEAGIRRGSAVASDLPAQAPQERGPSTRLVAMSDLTTSGGERIALRPDLPGRAEAVRDLRERRRLMGRG